MSVLSVRLPKELEKKLPKRERSAWVIQAIRERLKRERITRIAQDAADHADQELEAINDWQAATAPLPEKKR